ncbi:hypothetical protein [Nocardia brasiliensis]|uniref:hypothetical protein n=1 Tax=Nocardia brasiliensis TaxID=37326 RepID=UPI0036710AD2
MNTPRSAGALTITVLSVLALATAWWPTSSEPIRTAAMHGGVYAISRPQEQLLTLQRTESPTPIVVLPPTGEPGTQEWEVHQLDNGNVTIRNLASQTYLGYDANPQRIDHFPEPKEWNLIPAAEPFTYYIVVPDGTELAVDLSMLRIFPPTVALRPLESSNQHQAWKFEFHE